MWDNILKDMNLYPVIFLIHPIFILYYERKDRLMEKRTLKKNYVAISNDYQQVVLVRSLSFSRSSRQKVFCKTSVPRNNSRKAPVSEPLFNKVADPQLATLLKTRPWHRCFPVAFAKFLRTPFLTEHLWLLSYQTAPMLTCEIGTTSP